VVEASGARIANIKINGTVEMATALTASNPYLTINGQTGTGGGLCLRDAPFRVRTHDVVVHDMRFRPGDDNTYSPPADLDAVSCTNNPSSGSDVDSMVFNVIFDHCSLSWSSDEIIEFWNSAPSISLIKNVTLQYCILSEALLLTGAAILSGSGTGISVKNASLHHCLFVHNRRRNPLVAAATHVEVVNCVMHDCPGYVCVLGDSDNDLNYHGNTTVTESSSYTLLVEPDVGTTDPADYCEHWIYVDDNDGNYYSSDDWEIVGKGWGSVQGAGSSAFRTAWEASAPNHIANSGLEAVARATAYQDVLDSAGAFPRDAVDERVVQDVVDEDTGMIDSQSEVGGWPDLLPNYPTGGVTPTGAVVRRVGKVLGGWV
jgi:hypothetical protein